MKLVPRDPVKFESLKLLADNSRRNDLPINDPESVNNLILALRESLKKTLESDSTIFGTMVESMFLTVASSLGACSLIKQEDAGSLVAETENIKMPDYRIKTKTGEQIFVEVKNWFSPNLEKRFSFKREYLDGLKNYAREMGHPLLIALYHAQINQWTLLQTDFFVLQKDKYVITMEQAFIRNEMFRLGDLEMGTISPLTIRFLVQDNTTDCHAPNTHTVTFKGVEYSCGGKTIQKEETQQLALYLMLYGNWCESGPHARIKEGKMESIDIVYSQKREDSDQNFDLFGSLSSLISRQFIANTCDDGTPSQLTTNSEPASLGIQIPGDYESKELPLWQLSVVPEHCR